MGHGGDPFFISTPLYGHFSPFGKCIFLPSVNKSMGIKNAAFRAALLIIEFPHFRFVIFGILFLSFEFPIKLPCQKRSIESSRSNGNHACYSSAPAGFLRESVRFGEERVP